MTSAIVWDSQKIFYSIHTSQGKVRGNFPVYMSLSFTLCIVLFFTKWFFYLLSANVNVITLQVSVHTLTSSSIVFTYFCKYLKSGQGKASETLIRVLALNPVDAPFQGWCQAFGTKRGLTIPTGY